MLEASAGVDVGKSELHVYIEPVGVQHRISNEEAAIGELTKELLAAGVGIVVMEPTGRYHRLAEQTFVQAGLQVSLVNPLRSRRYAEAIGRLAKNDRVDAAMLARLGLQLEPEARGYRENDLRRLSDMRVARSNLVRVRTSLRQSAAEMAEACAVKALEEAAEGLDRHVTVLDTEMKREMEGNTVLARRNAILRSVPGIGEVTAATLCAEMPELGTLTGREAAALAGLAPYDRDSGQMTGVRRIGGGRVRPRAALYMAAITAIRVNSDMATTYRRLRTEGKKHKVAVVAVMRKLVVLANILLRDDRFWSEERPSNSSKPDQS